MKTSWGRGLAALIAASSLVLVGSVAATASPQPTAVATVAVSAATKVVGPVTIKTIPNKSVKTGAKATIKPVVKKKRSTKITSQVLTVKQGKKTIAKNKKSVALKAGKYKVTTTVKYTVPGSKATKTSVKSQDLLVKTKKKPSWVYSDSNWNCPAGYPIKGNASSMIYHVPSGAFYDRTNPEECFASRSAAEARGYRASMR
ncbi:hypothetical protein ACFY5D_12850 [Paeniglutamicibacter sp. NPDC012692]|uniref:sunset domain-containing protein n=1 Tax=Paeniglutamicibacter sp. NPDC012692 TaxID=3364388 RepID=UPI0036931CC6